MDDINVPPATKSGSEMKGTPTVEKKKDYRGFVAGVFSGIAKLSGPLDCLLQTVRNEGVSALYKGATPPLMGWMVMDSV
ncbi:hypothetical protein PRK78_002777 [Emydomyces testavorans]|uniref:Uncharacterized protein n=1 Tax=Emydomyces testavorans TaxID=2070801 RepID=A0AAF0IHW9_9EURO|nr:hypothetical protein PRK78_002777 [Emydomyces testavorans]